LRCERRAVGRPSAPAVHRAPARPPAGFGGTARRPRAERRLHRHRPDAEPLYLKRGHETLLQAVCSAGSAWCCGERRKRREWVFDSPRGRFEVRTMLKNPVWRKPTGRSSRKGSRFRRTRRPPRLRTLGEYALYFGDGFMITGRSTNGCSGAPCLMAVSAWAATICARSGERQNRHPDLHLLAWACHEGVAHQHHRRRAPGRRRRGGRLPARRGVGSPSDPRADAARLQRTNAQLQRQIELAAGREFYLVLDRRMPASR